MRKAVDVGCGTKKIEIEGYEIIRLDIRKETNPDIVADGKSLPFEPESIDLIFASHFLEHIGRNELYELMKNWRKVLRTGGKLYLILPDLEVAAIELLSGQTWPATWDSIYGAQSHQENFHRCGFTPPSLKAFLEKYGFEVTKIETKDREIHAHAVKTEIEYDG